MTIKRCPNGHFYDPDANISCPWCAVPTDDYERTRRINPAAVPMEGNAGSTVKLSPRNAPSSGSSIDEGYTVAVVKRKTGIDPVVGWLVCIKGPDRGRGLPHTVREEFGRQVRLHGHLYLRGRYHLQKRPCFRRLRPKKENVQNPGRIE